VPPLSGVKLVRPRRRPDGRQRLRALQLDPRPCGGTNQQLRGNPAQQPTRAITRSPGQDSALC